MRKIFLSIVLLFSIAFVFGQNININQIRKAPAKDMFLLSGTNRSFEYKNLYDFTGRVDSIYFADDSLRYMLIDSTIYALPLSFSLNGAWLLDGNTIADTNFIGTINNKDLVFKVNNASVTKFYPGYKYEFGHANSMQESYTLTSGNLNKLYGEYGIVFGENNFLETGIHSFINGESNITNEDYTFISGFENETRGNHNVIFGRENLITIASVPPPGGGGMPTLYGGQNYSFGNFNTINGSNNYIIGNENETDTSLYTFIYGERNNIERSENNFIVGNDNYGEEINDNFIFGNTNGINNSTNNYFFGDANSSNLDSNYVFGYNNQLNNTSGYLFGSNLISVSTGEILFGRYNKFDDGPPLSIPVIPAGEWRGEDILFAVANGESYMQRNNALSILKNGNVGVNIWNPDTTFHVDGAVKFTGSGTPGLGKLWTSDANGIGSWQDAPGAGGPETDPVWNIEKTGYQQDTDTTTFDATRYWVESQGYLTAYNETDPVWISEKGDYMQYSDTTLLIPTKWWVEDQGYLTAYNETDPVFLAHTAYDIGTGTGFLKNNGAGVWSYNNSVITGTGTANRIPYYDGTNSITSTAQLTYSANAFNIGASTDLWSSRYVFFPNIPLTSTLTYGLVYDNSTGEVKKRTFNITGWDDAANDRVVSTGFNTGNGVLTLTQNDSGTLTVDLDGRFLQTEVDGSISNEIQTIDTFGIYDTNKIRISLSDDGQLYKTLTLPSETDPVWLSEKGSYQLDSDTTTTDATRYWVTQQEFLKDTTTAVLTNKAIQPRVDSSTDRGTSTINVDETDVYENYSVSSTTTFSITGTPYDGQQLTIRLKGTSDISPTTLQWSNTNFSTFTAALPTSIDTSWRYLKFEYVSRIGKFVAIINIEQP